MKTEFVAALADIMARHALSELEYVSPDGVRLTLCRDSPAHARVDHETRVTPQAEPEAREPTQVRSDDDERLVLVESGMTGTFYRRPGPDEPAFVEVGDTVTEGQPLGTIDAMKTMIPVESPASGVLRRILAKDGDPVQPSSVLMEIVSKDRS